MAATNVQAFPGDVTITSNLAVSGSKFTYDNIGTTVFTGRSTAIASEIGYLDMSTSSASNNTHVKIFIKMGSGGSLSEAEYSFYIRPNAANFSLIYDYRNRNNTMTPVVYRTNATNLHAGGTSGVVRFGYSTASAQNVVWRVEVIQRSSNATFYPTNTGSAVVTTNLVHVTPAPFTRFDSNVAVGGNKLFVDTIGGTVGIGTNNPQEALHVAGSMRLGAAEGVDDDNLRSIVTTSPLQIHSNAEDLDGSGVSLNLRSGFNDSESNIQMISSKSNTTFQYISFATATTERMRITTAGNVGIGTTNPDYKLKIEQGEDNNSNGLFISNSNYGSMQGLNISMVNSGAGGFASYAAIQTYRSGVAAAATNLALNPTAGNVGIGSATPTQRLDVAGGIAFNAVLFCQGGYATSNYDDITNSKRIIDTGSRYRIFHNNDSILMFSSAGGNGTLAATTALSLNSTRVGCGTTYATSYCSVRGNYSNSQAPQTYNSAPPLCVVANSGADAQPICQFRSNQGVTNIRNDGIYHKRGNGDIMALYTSSSHVKFVNNTRSMILQLHTNGTAYFNCDLRADSYGNNSDDRIKHNESSIKNAIQTLFKLKPQKYDKVSMETYILEHSQYLNATDKEGYEWNDIEDGWIKRKPITAGVAQVETGLIAQDIWYDAPELRHIVNLPDDAIPDDTKPSEPDPGNIRSDPDYDSAGWGKMGPATVNYINLIPYLIKSIRELYNEVPRYKTSVSPELYSNVQDYRHMIVSRRGENIQLTNTENDKTVHGVISDIKTDTENYELLIEHTGLGNAWVINTGSNINAGDYITTSNVTGYGKLQDSAFCMNYTLAKSTIDCDFTLQTTPIKQKIRRLQDKTYWIKTQQLLDCSLMAYSNLSNDIRTTKTETYYNAYQNTHEIDEFSNVENYTLQSVMKNEEPVELTESDMDFEKYSNTYAFNTPFYTEPQTRDKYYRKQISKIDNEMEGYEPIVEQEMMDVLDDNGQVQWEDTGETRALYEMRYLTTDGSMTDQSNAVYTASLLPLVLHL
jgi:hypothetical protein